jgi:hypothetical protein
MLVMGMITIPPAHSPGTTVEVRDLTDTTNVFSFNTATTSVGDTFDVVVWVKGVSDLFAWQLEFAYDPAQLEVISAVQPTTDSDYVFYASTGPTMPLGPEYYSSSVVIGQTLLPAPGNFPFTGDGKLAVITLRIIAAPPKISLSSILDVETEGTFNTKLKDSKGAAISFTDVDGTFTYTWSPPATKPHLAVEPAHVEYGPSPPSAVGQQFNVSMEIKNLDVAWNLTNANFTLTFNTTVIEVIRITADALWTVKNVDNTTTPGKIQVFVGGPTSTPSGNVTILTVEFRITYQGAYPSVDVSELILENIRLMDHVAEIPTESPVNGKVVIKGLLPTTLEVKPHGYITDRLELFNVEIWLNNIICSKRLVGLQFRLLYNDTLLQLVNVTEGPFLRQFGETLSFSHNETDFVENGVHYGPHVLVGILILPNQTQGWEVFPEGSGVVATVTFKGIYRPPYPKVGTSDLQLFWVKLVDDEANTIGIGPTISGYYKILPITPSLKVEPTTYEAKKTEEIFNIDVTIHNILTEAEMVDIRFELQYNATQIQFISVTEGSFLSGFGLTTFNYTLIDNGIKIQNYLNPPYSSFPNGDGTIATVTFKAIYRGSYPEEVNSTLGLREIVLLDRRQSEMPSAFVDGFYRMLPYRWPVASFTISPSTGIVSQKIDFNASGSYDPDGYIVSYTWDFGDGNITTVATPTVSHIYKASGTYNVNLTVTDDDGLTNSMIESFTVGRLSSTITINVDPQIVTVGSSVVISGDIDPVKENVNVTIQYKVLGGTWSNLVTVQTDANGHYTYTWNVAEAGIYELKASWMGDASTLPAESGIKTVKVEAPVDNLLYIILAIIIILALTVSVILYYKKIKKPEPPM